MLPVAANLWVKSHTVTGSISWPFWTTDASVIRALWLAMLLRACIVIAEGVSKLSFFAKNHLLRRGLSLIFSTLLVGSIINAQVGDNSGIQSLVDEAQSNQKEFSSRLRGYTYTLKRSEQELNDRGEVKKEKVKVFQAFPVAHGAPVMMLLSENGKDLSPARLAKEKARANSEWQKRKKESEKNVDQAGPLATPFFFRGSEFTMLRTERYNNRDAIVLKFKPRPDFKPTKDSEQFASSLEGELWIDVSEKAIVKLDAKLAESYNAGLLGHLSPLQAGTTLYIESSPVSNALWAVTRMEFTPGQKKGPLFSKAVRYSYRQKEELSDYRPFNKDADDLFAH
jgi:hypothetical protein